MKKLNNNTKSAKNFIREYLTSHAYNIYDAYDKPSQNKISIYYNIINNLHKKNIDTTTIKIISHNTFNYTIAYTNNNNLYIITKNNDYMIENYQATSL